MDTTNYPLLSIVGVVALTAIVAMFLAADARSPGMLPSTVQLADGLGSSAGLTGNVIAEDRATRPEPIAPVRARPELNFRVYDYDGSGAVDYADLALFDAVLRREQFCPAGRVCDLTGDQRVTDADRQALLRGILRAEAEATLSADLLSSGPIATAGADARLIAASGGLIY